MPYQQKKWACPLLSSTGQRGPDYPRVYHKRKVRSKLDSGVALGDAGTVISPLSPPLRAGVLPAALVVLLTLACSSDDPGDMLVFAAASLQDPLEEVKASFEQDTGIVVSISYGGSQSLAQQIVSGAPAALFVSAGASPVKFVEERTTLAREPVHIVGNRLVIAMSADEGALPDGIQGLMRSHVERIAIADPKLAPAGRYARESLEYHGLWGRLLPKMVFAADVRAALAYVESGNADAALVYATDAAASQSVNVAADVPKGSHSLIVYPAALMAGSGHGDSAWKLVEYLRGAEAREVFARHGFTAPE